MNLVNAAEQVMYGSLITRSLFGLDLIPWATQGWLTPKTKTGGGPHGGAAWVQALSMSELVEAIIPGGATGGMASSGWNTLPNVMKMNAKAYGPKAFAMSLALPIAFTVGKSITKKPRAAINKSLRMAGVTQVKV